MTLRYGIIQLDLCLLTCFGRVFIAVSGEFVDLISCGQTVSFPSFDTEELSCHWYIEKHAYTIFFCNLVLHPVLGSPDWTRGSLVCSLNFFIYFVVFCHLPVRLGSKKYSLTLVVLHMNLTKIKYKLFFNQEITRVDKWIWVMLTNVSGALVKEVKIEILITKNNFLTLIKLNILLYTIFQCKVSILVFLN